MPMARLWLPNKSGTSGDSNTILLWHRRVGLSCAFFYNMPLLDNNMGLSANNMGLSANNIGIFENNAGVIGNSAGVLNTD